VKKAEEAGSEGHGKKTGQQSVSVMGNKGLRWWGNLAQALRGTEQKTGSALSKATHRTETRRKLLWFGTNKRTAKGTKEEEGTVPRTGSTKKETPAPAGCENGIGHLLVLIFHPI